MRMHTLARVPLSPRDVCPLANLFGGGDLGGRRLGVGEEPRPVDEGDELPGRDATFVLVALLDRLLRRLRLDFGDLDARDGRRGRELEALGAEAPNRRRPLGRLDAKLLRPLEERGRHLGLLDLGVLLDQRRGRLGVEQIARRLRLGRGDAAEHDERADGGHGDDALEHDGSLSLMNVVLE